MAHVQASGKLQADNVTGVQNFTMPSNWTAGNLGVLLFVGFNDRPASATINGATGTLDVEQPASASSGAAIYSTPNLTGSSNAFSITVSAGDYITLAAIEESGMATSSHVRDTNNATTGTTTTPAISSDSTPLIGDVVVAVVAPPNGGSGTQSYTTPSGFTARFVETDFVNHEAGQGSSAAVTVAGVQTATWGATSGTHETVIAVYKAAAAAPPTITAQPTDQTVNNGGTPTFSATATGATSQRWQDNSGGSFADIGGATSTSYSPGTVGYAQQGRRYRIIFTNAGGDTTSAEAVLRVAYNLTGTGARRRQTFASAPFASTGPLGAPSAGGPISATPGTYTWVGPAATLAVQSIAATPGTYTWVGAAASIALQQIAATPGAYTWVGPAASFPVPQISATPGTYTWVGSASTFPVPQVAATPGAYVWVGPVAVITTPASATVVDATPGPYTWVGAAVAFPVPQVAVTPGTYTWVGPAAVITTPPAGVTTIDSTPGPYVWTGSVATFPIQTLSATPGAYTWTGANATFAIATVDATPGAWAWTGPLAGIVQLVNIDATPGSWAWTGRQASIDNGGDAERFVFWAGFAQAQRRRDRERERAEAEELAQRVATRAIQEARAASARVSTQAAIDRARREAKEASARMTAALERMILAALAIEENNRLAELEEEELAAMMLLQIAAGD